MNAPQFPSLFPLPQNNQNNRFGVPQNQMQGGTQISQQYTPGGTQTNTLGGSYGVAQTPDLTQYFNAMLKYKMAMEAQQRQAAMPQKQEAPRQYRDDSNMQMQEDSLRRAQIEAQKQALYMEMRGNQPLSASPGGGLQYSGFGFNQTPGQLQIDPVHLSPQQRRAYLPNNAEGIGVSASGSTGSSNKPQTTAPAGSAGVGSGMTAGDIQRIQMAKDGLLQVDRNGNIIGLGASGEVTSTTPTGEGA